MYESYIAIILPILAIAIIIMMVVKYLNNKKADRIWPEYQDALKSGDKKAALDAGRKYYSALRGGKLTIYDEQAITNDLLTMDENKN